MKQNITVEETRELITHVTDSKATLDERHDAFGKLVVCYQDFAYGCAYAVLNDFYLAQEAAQEAFITAWQKLDQLRAPEAFPIWFRRIVLTACHRLTRSRRLLFVPLRNGLNVVAKNGDPLEQASQRELQERVLTAIRSLPERERLVTVLFYLGEYSQAEISDFLEVPLTTVVKRLYFARQRLKERMWEMFKDELQTHRPSLNDAFAEQVQTRLRPFAEADWEPITALAYGLEPNYRADNEAWLRNRRDFDETRYIRRQYVAEHAETGRLLGYGSIEQTIFLPKYRLFLLADPKWLRAGVGELLLDQLTTDLRAANAITVWHRNFAEQADILRFLTERGFVETARLWDLRLDVERADPSAFQPLQEQVKRCGVEITTFATERERDPHCLRKLHEFLNSVKADDPQRQPFTPAPFESLERWCASSAFVPDACFIAKHGNRYVGFTDLIRYELLARGITQGFTGVARDFRRQGVATALKLRVLEYSREQGLKTIRAFLYSSQKKAMLLNEKLGFRPAFCHVTVEQCLKDAAAIDPASYDGLVGRYAPRADILQQHRMPAGLTVTIKRVGNRLISEMRDMQDVLVPESESVFFIKEHYGQIEFVKDARAQVTHLIYRESGMEVRADKIA